MEEQLRKHGPFAMIIGVMGSLGVFINSNEGSNSTVFPTLNLCLNATKTIMSDLPQGLGPTTIALTLAFPVVPILINSKTKWNEFKFDVVKSHVVGQSSVFGVSEVLRHVLTMPEQSFLSKCNISYMECLAKNQFSSLPLYSTDNTSFCNSNNTQIFDSLHHFPDLTCGFIGSSLVTFVATLYFWRHFNSKQKQLYEASSLQHVILIAIHVATIILILIYVYYLYKSYDYIQIVGFLIGGAIQFMIIKTTMAANNEINVLP